MKWILLILFLCSCKKEPVKTEVPHGNYKSWPQERTPKDSV